jgi:hypothetical protein
MLGVEIDHYLFPCEPFLHQDAAGVEQNTVTQFDAIFCYCHLRWFPHLKW